MSLGVVDQWTGGEDDASRIRAYLQRYEDLRMDPLESLIPVLHHIQEHYGYVPEGAAAIVSDRWHIPETDIFGVVTFYADFKSEPGGENLFWVCEGAACYFMGGPEMGEVAQKQLGIDYGESTLDGRWQLLRADFCFGACHLAPLAEVNHRIEGYLTPERVEQLLAHPPAHGGHAEVGTNFGEGATAPSPA